MPRQSAASAAVPIHAGTRRLRPPDDFAAGSPERKLFVDLVASVPASHFRDSDLPVLCAYVRAVCLERTASAELQASGYLVDNKPSGWFSILAQSARSVTVLSSKLRLNPLSRAAPSLEPEQPISYYERQRMIEGRRDDEPN
jgi:phage terminase small subunit